MSYRVFINLYNGQLPPLRRFFIVTMSDSSLSIFILSKGQSMPKCLLCFRVLRFPFAAACFPWPSICPDTAVFSYFFDSRLLFLSLPFLVPSNILFFLQQASHTHLRSIPSCARGMLHKVFLPKFFLAFAFRVAGLTVCFVILIPPGLSVVRLFISLFLQIFVSSNPFNLFLQSLLCHQCCYILLATRKASPCFRTLWPYFTPQRLTWFRFIAFRYSHLLHLVCPFSSHHKEFERVLNVGVARSFCFSEEMFYTCVLHRCSLLECLWSQAIIHGLFCAWYTTSQCFNECLISWSPSICVPKINFKCTHNLP